MKERKLFILLIGLFVLNGIFFYSNIVTRQSLTQRSYVVLEKEMNLNENQKELEKIHKKMDKIETELISDIEKITQLKNDFKIQSDILEKKLYIFAKIIHCEDQVRNANEIYSGAAVGRSIIKRLEDPEFGNTLESIIWEKNQFSPISDGSWDKKEPTELDYKAAKLALSNEPIYGENGIEISEATFFVQPETANKKNYEWFQNNLIYLDKIGCHEFYSKKYYK